MKKYLRVLSACLALSLCVGVFSARAAGGHFTDVRSTHWAAGFINEMAEGGLISGYGNGYFGPDDLLNMDQMATIICSALGAPQKQQDGYWAYGAVEYCVNTLKCLPSQGDFTAANYAVPCSRELAYHMLMTSLGVGPDSKATPKNTLLPTEIPDYADIDIKYKQSVYEAYKSGLAEGVDEKMTFLPKAFLSRAQAATMFVRAGWTKASQVATPVTEGKTLDEIFAAVKATGDWEETQSLYGGQALKYKDTYAGYIVLEMFEAASGKILELTLYEKSIEGRGLTDYSAYKYDGRQVAKSVLDIAYPTQAYDAYMGMKSVLLQETYEYGGSQYPSVLRWYDGRVFLCGTAGPSHCMIITIRELNDEAAYNRYKAAIRDSATLTYLSYSGSRNNDITAFELDKW